MPKADLINMASDRGARDDLNLAESGVCCQ